LTFGNLLETGNSTSTPITFTNPLPVNLRPTGEISQVCVVYDNGAPVYGLLQIGGGGDIQFGVDPSLAGFTPTTSNAGFIGFNVCYETNA
jgi:hypothetical protein